MMNKQNSPGTFLGNSVNGGIAKGPAKRPASNSLEIFKSTVNGLLKAENTFLPVNDL